MIRKFIIAFMSKFLDIVVVLSLLGVLISAIMTMWTVGFFASLGVILIGVISIALVFGFIYIMLDIRDMLQKILDKKE